MAQVRVGIIGCGGIAVGKHLPALAKVHEAALVAFCDYDEGRAWHARNHYGREHAAVYTNYHDMLRDPSIDVIHVCTANDSHADITIAALEAGKHVMCEKPMAKTVVDAKRMLEAAKRTGKKLSIGYQNRFRSDSRFLKKACTDGDLGEIYFAKAHAIRRRAVPTWGVFLDEEKQGGGPLIDIGTHALDLALWMMDNYEPKVVLGRAYHKLSQTENAANAWGPWDPKKFTVEDSAFAMITMKNGASIYLESSWALNSLEVDEAKVTLHGTKAGSDMKNNTLRFNGEQDGRLYVKEIQFDGGGVAFYDSVKEDPAEFEARAWIQAVINDEELVVKPEQALVVSEILEAIYESSRTGQPVFFD